MIPANAFTVTPVIANFQAPYNTSYSATSQIALGGNALGDPSAGRQVQNWIASIVGATIEVKPVASAVQAVIPAVGALTVSLAFDNNMAVTVAYQTATDSKLYYYDTLTAGFITRSFPGTTSCRVCVDDARDVYNADSDVIFAYTDGVNLYYRQQRDRYDIPILVGATTKKLRQVAPSVVNRLQFELR